LLDEECQHANTINNNNNKNTITTCTTVASVNKNINYLHRGQEESNLELDHGQENDFQKKLTNNICLADLTSFGDGARCRVCR